MSEIPSSFSLQKNGSNGSRHTRTHATGKGTLVREVDALDGLMGLAALSGCDSEKPRIEGQRQAVVEYQSKIKRSRSDVQIFLYFC